MLPLLTTSRLILKQIDIEDLSSLADFWARNHRHFQKWESNLIGDLCEKNLEQWVKEHNQGTSIRLTLMPKSFPHLIIGMCHFTQIFHGAFQACYLGYKLDSEFQGKGLMFEALQTSIKYIFEEVKLHRIMANYMPQNIRSGRLLKRLGFAIEGYAKHYLFINNKWEDHVLTSLTLESWKQNNPII